MRGLHLTADLRGCAADAPPMTDRDALRDCCLGAVERAGLSAVGELFHPFSSGPADADSSASVPMGITGVVLLAESHLAVHTWPELAAATLDVYVCNHGADNSARAETLLAALVSAFAPATVERHALHRGRATTAGEPMSSSSSRLSRPASP